MSIMEKSYHAILQENPVYRPPQPGVPSSPPDAPVGEPPLRPPEPPVTDVPVMPIPGPISV